MNCDKHKNAAAIAQCTICKRHVCEKCYSEGLSICKRCRRRIVFKRLFATLIELVLPIGYIGVFIFNKVSFALEFSILAIVYALIKDSFGGRSFMKRVLGLKVVSVKTGKPCNIRQSIIRNIIVVLTMPLGAIIEMVIIEYTKDMRRLGDKIAGTKVIEFREVESPQVKDQRYSIFARGFALLSGIGSLIVFISGVLNYIDSTEKSFGFLLGCIGMVCCTVLQLLAAIKPISISKILPIVKPGFLFWLFLIILTIAMGVIVWNIL